MSEAPEDERSDGSIVKEGGERLRIGETAPRMRIAPQGSGQGSALPSRYVVTAAITVVGVALFVLRYVWSGGGDGEHLLRMGGNYGPLVKEGQIYRLLASAFLHGDPIHLLMNGAALWSFGTVLEALLGPRRYLVLYGASALVGSLASAFVTHPRFSVGASGAVWGLMTAGVALVYRPQGLLPASSLDAARKRAWSPLVLNLLYSFSPGIDLLAHLGGGVTGAGLILTGALTRGIPPVGFESRRGRKDGLLWTALAAVTALAMGASVVAAMAIGKPWEAGKPPELERTAVGATAITLELPKGFRDHVQEEGKGGEKSYIYGGETDAPFLVQVEAHDLGAVVPPEAMERELEAIRKILEGQLEPTFTTVRPPHLATVGRYRCVVKEEKNKNDVPLKSYFVILGARLVTVRTIGVGDLPKSWIGVEEKIVSSIEAK